MMMMMIPKFLLLSVLTLFLGVGCCYRMEVGCVSDVSEERASYIFRIEANTAEKVAGLGGPQIQEQGSGKVSVRIDSTGSPTSDSKRIR
jgi:hypothetical protein